MSTSTSPLQGAEFWKKETKGLAEPNASESLALTAERSAASALETCWGIDRWPDWREAAKQIKNYALSNLDRLLEEFVSKLEAKGVKVYWAKDAEEANRIVLEIAQENNVKKVVKAKSMVSEEIALNKAFASVGIQALETDLGEYIVQLLGQRHEVDRLILLIELGHRVEHETILLLIEVLRAEHLCGSGDRILIPEHGADDTLFGFLTVGNDPGQNVFIILCHTTPV